MKLLAPVLLTVLLDLLGFGLVIPLLSFYAESFHATPREVTGIMAMYSIGQFLFGPLWGALSDRVGRRPVMLVSIGGSALFLALFALSPSVPMLFVTRFLHGACAANIGTAQAIVADVTSREDRARGMGLIGAAFGVGFTLGPLVGGVLGEYGQTAPIWLAAGLSAINFVWTLVSLPETRHLASGPPAHRRTLDPRHVLSALAHPVIGMVVGLTFVATVAFAMMESTFALVAEHEWGMGQRDVGLFFGAVGIIGIVIQGGLIGRLTRRFGSPLLLNVGYLATASGMAALAVTRPDGLWLLDGAAGIGLGCVLVAVGSSLSNPSLTSIVSRAASADEQGNVLGVNQSLASLGRAIAPALGGEIYTIWYTGGAFAVGALLMTVALVLSIPAARRALAASA